MTLDELKQALTALGAKPALALVAAIEERAGQIEAEATAAVADAKGQADAMKERLARSMEREAKLREENAHLRAAAAAAERQAADMSEHPDVKRAEREKLSAQRAAIDERLKALADPEPAPAPAVEPEPAAEAKGE